MEEHKRGTARSVLFEGCTDREMGCNMLGWSIRAPTTRAAVRRSPGSDGGERSEQPLHVCRCRKVVSEILF